MSRSAEALGQIIQMGPVTILFSPNDGSEVKKDRYLVLFAKHLLLLSISEEMTSFTFEYSMLLDDVTLPRLPEPQSTPAKSTFELLQASAGATNRFVFQCASAEEVRNWIIFMQKCKSECVEKTPTPSLRAKSASLSHRDKEQQSDTLSKRTNLTSGSSSLSSGSLNFAKGVVPETRSSYWANKSLLPHPPLRSPSLGSAHENGLKSHSSTALSAAHVRRPSSPSDDMAILQVIESYYFTGKKNQPPPPGETQIILVDDENIAVETPCHTYGPAANNASIDEKSLLGTVNALVNEVNQMRQEIDSLASCIQRERKARKRLKHFVAKLAIGSEDIDT